MEEIATGARGRAVADVQTRLAALGYSVGPTGADGVFAQATQDAVGTFQGDHGLPETGAVDGPTWRALVDATLSLGDRVLYLRRPHFHGEDVRQLQQALATLGFRCAIDGVFGVNTESAVRDFQTNVGLLADGMVGRASTAALTNLAPALADRRPVPGPRRRGAVFGRGLAGRTVAIHALSDRDGADTIVGECAQRLASLLELAGARTSLDSEVTKVPDFEPSAEVTFRASTADSLFLAVEGRLGVAALDHLRANLARRVGPTPVGGESPASTSTVEMRLAGYAGSDLEELSQRVAVAVFDSLAAAADPDDEAG